MGFSQICFMSYCQFWCMAHKTVSCRGSCATPKHASGNFEHNNDLMDYICGEFFPIVLIKI